MEVTRDEDGVLAAPNSSPYWISSAEILERLGISQTRHRAQVGML